MTRERDHSSTTIRTINGLDGERLWCGDAWFYVSYARCRYKSGTGDWWCDPLFTSITNLTEFAQALDAWNATLVCPLEATYCARVRDRVRAAVQQQQQQPEMPR